MCNTKKTFLLKALPAFRKGSLFSLPDCRHAYVGAPPLPSNLEYEVSAKRRSGPRGPSPAGGALCVSTMLCPQFVVVVDEQSFYDHLFTIF